MSRCTYLSKFCNDAAWDVTAWCAGCLKVTVGHGTGLGILPMGLIDTAAYWRARANEARITADCMVDAGCRNIMLGIAKDYERIVRWFEAQAASMGEHPS